MQAKGNHHTAVDQKMIDKQNMLMDNEEMLYR